MVSTCEPLRHKTAWHVPIVESLAASVPEVLSPEGVVNGGENIRCHSVAGEDALDSREPTPERPHRQATRVTEKIWCARQNEHAVRRSPLMEGFSPEQSTSNGGIVIASGDFPTGNLRADARKPSCEANSTRCFDCKTARIGGRRLPAKLSLAGFKSRGTVGGWKRNWKILS